MPIINDIPAFQAFLTANANSRILALCGAGLSAASGLPTFRGAGGLWRNHDATRLATPEAFKADPALVWLFYAYRRHMALEAKPNPAHYALAALARKRKEFLCLTQNVDNLSQRAGHPLSQLRPLHGNLFTIKCFNRRCTHIEHNNTADPLVPSLAPASVTAPADATKPLPLLDPDVPLAHIPPSELPRCPKCASLTRPGVVWFGESLDGALLREIDEWLDQGPIGVIFVIGTGAQVWPAAGYVQEAAARGARVCVVNTEVAEETLGPEDFGFVGDAAALLPRLLEPVIGSMKEDGTFG
ncbi:hypothetical protein ACRALDRAFT_1070906 [Sodiomyces alcalophilus JCM 7366]|uniref:uncharacterized protein n=1 Tax=Sodiomyces alcalophilus JCM 7366 TaxID=591952 RepID=UPI0039B64568